MTEENNTPVRLLVVDDEKSICDILGQFLQKKGYEVASAPSGERAQELLEQHGADLLLTDIKMPGMSGVDLLKWVKESERHRSMPVLITTGYPTLDTAIEALKLGAFDYLTKPFHLEEISEKIRRALANKQLEEENLLFSKLVSLHEVTKVLASTYQVSELNHKFLDYSLRLSHADGGVLMFQHGTGAHSIVDASLPPFDRGFWERPAFAQLAALVTQRREPLTIEGTASAEGIEIPAELNSCIVFPLKTPKRIIGVLQLARGAGRKPFSNVELEIINVLTSQAGISIENVHLYQNIRDNYLKTIRAFALAVEAKDRYTHGHSEMVMNYAVVIARELGLPDYEVEHVKYAGLLHDIGKIGISELILNKPGRLTPDEFAEIRNHPDMGVRIIADVPFLKSLVPLVRHHHEFYNGRGYPAALAGETIPLGARILTVADAYEAMTSDRPYRKSLTRERGMQILAEERGKQFDGHIADVFLKILGSGYTFT